MNHWDDGQRIRTQQIIGVMYFNNYYYDGIFALLYLYGLRYDGNVLRKMGTDP